MQEPHRKEILLSVQLFQIEVTHLLKMAINILDCNPSQHLFPSCSIERYVGKICIIQRQIQLVLKLTPLLKRQKYISYKDSP